MTIEQQQQEEEPIKEFEQTNEIPLSTRPINDYPLQFDTRDQQIPLEQIMQDNTFFPIDLNTQIPEDNRDQSLDPNQFLPTITVVNSSEFVWDFFYSRWIFLFDLDISDQVSSPVENQQQQQQSDGSRQNTRSANRGGHKNYRRRSNNYYPQYREGPRMFFFLLSQFSIMSFTGGGGGGHYDNSYGRGRRPYADHNRGRGGYRGKKNPIQWINHLIYLKGNRGGNYRAYNYNENGYQNPAQYQNVYSAPPSQQQ